MSHFHCWGILGDDEHGNRFYTCYNCGRFTKNNPVPTGARYVNKSAIPALVHPDA
jgi:hypothetical protein